MYCKRCGREIDDDARFCSVCGAPVGRRECACPPPLPPGTRLFPMSPVASAATVDPGPMPRGGEPRQTDHASALDERTPPTANANAFGTAGFVVALISLIFGWIPIYGWIPWTVGAILSGIGLGRRPRGLAIAGSVLSVITLLIIILIFAIMVITMDAACAHDSLRHRFT